MMNTLLILTIVFGGSILALAIVGSTILMAIKMFKGNASRKGQKLETEESRMVQEIYQGLSKMEKRIEAVEAIILDQGRKDRTS